MPVTAAADHPADTPPTAGPPATPSARPPDRHWPGGAPPAVRLTGRGGVLAVFALSFIGAFGASTLHFGPLAGASYLAACMFAAAMVRRSQLLLVVVTPPMLFAAAVVCAQLATAPGGLLSAVGGVLVTLGNVAPWLFAGTAAGAVIAFARGLVGNVRDLRRKLRAEQAGPGEMSAARRDDPRHLTD